MKDLRVHTTEAMFESVLKNGEPANLFNGEKVVYSETAVRVAIVKALKWYEEELMKVIKEEAQESQKEIEANLTAISFFGYRKCYERLINGNGEEAHKMYEYGNEIKMRTLGGVRYE